MFRAEGSHAAMQEWFDAVSEHVGPYVFPGGAAVYTGITRGRLKANEGRGPDRILLSYHWKEKEVVRR